MTVGQRASVDLAVDNTAGTVSHPAEPAGPGNYADGTVTAESAVEPEAPIRDLPGKLPAVEKAPS